MIKRIPLALCALALLSATVSAQFVRTGDVQSDFPASQMFPDPGGIDVGVPPLLVGSISGWDMEFVALSYDVTDDSLHIGIDCFDPMGTNGICGDADGDGDPSNTSSGLSMSGGIDRPDFAGTEAFTFAMDLDDDGNLDIIAGLPFGVDITGFTVANFSGSIFAPFASFGAALPQHTGTVFSSPTPSAPDLEFSITNFSFLMLQYFQPGQTSIGIHAFMGSQEDAGIGEDFFPGLFALSIPTTQIECLPVPNVLELEAATPVPGGVNLSFTLGTFDGYICCVMISPDFDPVGKTIPIAGNPTIHLGPPNSFSTLFVFQLLIPPITGRAVSCKTLANDFIGVPAGLTLYWQVLQYPINLGMGDFYASNVVPYTF